MKIHSLSPCPAGEFTIGRSRWTRRGEVTTKAITETGADSYRRRRCRRRAIGTGRDDKINAIANPPI